MSVDMPIRYSVSYGIHSHSSITHSCFFFPFSCGQCCLISKRYFVVGYIGFLHNCIIPQIAQMNKSSQRLILGTNDRQIVLKVIAFSKNETKSADILHGMEERI